MYLFTEESHACGVTLGAKTTVYNREIRVHLKHENQHLYQQSFNTLIGTTNIPNDPKCKFLQFIMYLDIMSAPTML